MHEFPIPTLFALAYPGLPLPTVEDPEIWLPIPDFPGYDCSSHARIRSYKKRFGTPGIQGGGTKMVICDEPQKILKPHITHNRKNYGLSNNNDTSHFQAAQILLRTFISPWPGKGWEACHKDSDPSNDCLSNLRWDTKSGNVIDRVLDGTHQNCKLLPTDIPVIRERITRGDKLYEIAADYHVGYTTIGAVKSGANWWHI